MSDSITVPCVMSCVIATSALFVIARSSYVMGSNSDARGGQSYQTAFWGGSVGLMSLSLAFGIVKMLDEQ
jgi:hypothetical protein